MITQSAISPASSRAHRCSVTASLNVLGRELPEVGSVAMVVSWFGSDLRIGQCEVRPKVEFREVDGAEMPWRAGGSTRGARCLRGGWPVIRLW